MNSPNVYAWLWPPRCSARRSPRRCRSARARRYGRPSARPFMSPPRNASPTPVGSTMRRGGTAGTSIAAVRGQDRRSVLAARDDQRLAALENGGFVEPGLLLEQLELVVVADDDRSRRRRRPSARRPTCARTAGRDRRCSGCRASGTPPRTAPWRAGSFGEMIASPQSGTSRNDSSPAWAMAPV